MAIFVIFGDKMANFVLIGFKIGLCIKVNDNNGEKNVKSSSQKFGQNFHQLAQNRPDATLAREH